MYSALSLQREPGGYRPHLHEAIQREVQDFSRCAEETNHPFCQLTRAVVREDQAFPHFELPGERQSEEKTGYMRV